MSPRRVKAIVRKEFYHLIRDFRSLYLAFVLPLVLILLFGYALSLDVDNVETAVVDQDHTETSRDFVRALDASAYFHVGARLDDTRGVAEELDHGRAMLAVIIPPGWSADIRAGRAAPLQILLDGSDPNFSNITRGYITSFIEGYNRKLLMEFLNVSGASTIEPPVEARIRVWFNEDLESRNFIIPGIIAVIIMIGGHADLPGDRARV